jgi:large subunit ribosomal protein L9
MKVILKQDVEKLGRRGDVINVAPGYGRNYLIPRKMAMAVTATNMKAIEIERQALKKKLEAERKTHQSLVEKLNQVTLTFSRRAGEKDVIFGSVSSGDIRDALAGLGHDIDKKKILLDEPIKRLGNFTVPVKISMDDRAEVKIVVAREEIEGEGAGGAGAAAEGPASGKD